MAGNSTYLYKVLAAFGINVVKVLDEAEQGITIKSTRSSLFQMIIVLNHFLYNWLAFLSEWILTFCHLMIWLRTIFYVKK
jgi:hypothetical protein